MELRQIYQPIKHELSQVEQRLKQSLNHTRHGSILEINRYLLDAGGKRLRPALIILCAKATLSHKPNAISHKLINIACALELIHMASLIHDDVIDHAPLRHNKPTINYKWGSEASIALGDYLYSIAFELIARSGNADILECISSATKSMCEGELVQVCERDSFSLCKERYITIVKKKTASLFAASCQAGAMVSHCGGLIQNTFREYGLNFGIAFQIMDDCLDLIGKEKDLGKSPGADFKMGELTLPVLNLIRESRNKKRVLSLMKNLNRKEAFKELRQIFMHSPAFSKTKEDVLAYAQKAKKSLNRLSGSYFKESLFALADYVAGKVRYDDKG